MARMYPDIDVDPNGREAVIAHIAERFGADHISQINTVGTLAARSAIQNVGKALGFDSSFYTNISKQIPQGVSLREASTVDVAAGAVASQPLTLVAPAGTRGRHSLHFEISALDGGARDSVESSFFGPL